MDKTETSGAALVMLPADEVDASSLPALVLPFATVLDARRAMPTDEDELISALLVAGCTLFACVGSGAEELHDTIDEIIEELGYLHVVTTFHGNEQTDDVVALLKGFELEAVLALVDPTSSLGLELARAFRRDDGLDTSS